MASRYDDDDDWTGTPPEGHITRDRADPGLGIVVVVVLALAL
jgi:hypothetical protein